MKALSVFCLDGFSENHARVRYRDGGISADARKLMGHIVSFNFCTFALVPVLVGGLWAGLAVAPAVAEVHGKCGFDAAELAFSGNPLAQAGCLLRHVGRYASIDATAAVIPPFLRERIGQPTTIIDQAVRSYVAANLRASEIPGGRMNAGLSHARGGSPDAPAARYFVIHDTSSPYLGNITQFPGDIDNSSSDLSGYLGSDAAAHLFINRLGEWQTGHNFSVPWRATKLEVRVVGIPAKGLFLHVELVQPRLKDPAGHPRNDAIAPNPGFTKKQYDALALAYILASVRGGEWLIPAFHATLDQGLDDGHDDPQNFDLIAFSNAIQGRLAVMTK